MKIYRISILVMFLLLVVGRTFADNLTVETVTMSAGETKQVSIGLKNSDRKYTAFQFDLALPEGITIAKNSNGKLLASLNSDRIDDHTLTVTELGNNTYRFLAFSMSNAEFYGTSGVLLNITLQANTGISGGTRTATLKSQVFTDKNGTQYKWSDATFSIQIQTEAIVVTAKSYTREYGDANPSFEYTVSGGSISGTPKITCSATKTSSVGTYTIKIEKGSITNSNVKFVDGTLTITKAPLTITAKSYTRKQGEENPTFEVTYSGFKNNETSSVLTRKPTITCSATTSSPAGTYAITVSGAEAQNYSFTYVNGVLTVTEDSQVYAYNFQSGGIYYNFIEGNNVSVTYGNTQYQGNIVIPDHVSYNGKEYSVTSIGESAFYGCSGLTSITIPNSVTNIGSYAFYGCSGLTSITIPNSVTSISRYVFYGCSSLASITIPNSVTYIGYSAFENCFGLTSIAIPNSVTTIENYAFNGCSSLPSITIPNSVTNIGIYAFYCSGLTNVVSEIQNPFEIENWVFSSDTYSKATLTVPSGTKTKYQQTNYWNKFTNIVETSSTSSGEWKDVTSSFDKSIAFTKIRVQNKKTNYGTYCCVFFSTIPNDNTTSDTKYNINFNRLTIGDGVEQDDASGYIYINTCTPVGDNWYEYEFKQPVYFSHYQSNAPKNQLKAFVGGTNQDTSTKRTIHVATAGTLPNLIPPSEKYIVEELTLTGELNGTDFRLLRDMAGNNYLRKGTDGKLKVLDFSGAKVVAGGEKYIDTDDSSESYHYTLNNNNELPQHVFCGCKFTSIIISTSVTNIGEYAFWGCSGLTSITIPNSVTNIGSSAFKECSGLTSITIPNFVTSIGDHTFEGCRGLTSITIPNSVTSIGEWAFYGCRCLASITIPNSVTSIGEWAFSGCSGLTSITFPNSVTSIGYYAFEYCSALSSLTIPNSVTSIGYGAFANCSGLSSIKVDNNNKKYDSRNNCNAIVEISTNTLITGCKNTVIPNSVTSIGHNAFWGCSGLSSLTIPNSVTSIGDYAFADCQGLTSIIISNSVTSIGNDAFENCYVLTSVTIPNSVTSIGAYAFDRCSGLTDVISEIQNPFEIYGVFSNDTYSKATLTVPLGTKTKYQQTHSWNMFTNIKEREGQKYSLSITASGYGYAYYEGTTIRNTTRSFNVSDGASATISFTPNSGYRVASLYVNNNNVTSSISNNSYTIYNIDGNTTVSVTFGEDSPGTFYYNGITYYCKTSTKEAEVQGVDNNLSDVDIPSSVSYNGNSYQVTSIANGVFSNRTFNYVSLPSTITTISNTTFSNTMLGALVWNANTSLSSSVFSNMAMSTSSNFLLYVNSKSYAPSNVKNVVVGNAASSITLTDATNTRFYCPKAFTAQTISYTHHYGMTTGGNGKGWETISLPFDVAKIEHATKGVLTPFALYQSNTDQRPFWLYELGSNGFKKANAIKANTPYIISMPNNSSYDPEYILSGDVTFSATNVNVRQTSDLVTSASNGKMFIPAFAVVEKSSTVYPLNVTNNLVTNTSSYDAGSRFIGNLRKVYPFEAYMTTSSSNRVLSIDLDNEGTTGIDDIPMKAQGETIVKVYSISGQLLFSVSKEQLDDALKQLPTGVYIVNGKKMVKM